MQAARPNRTRPPASPPVCPQQKAPRLPGPAAPHPPQFSKDKELVSRIEQNTQMYLSLFADAADMSMPRPTLPADEMAEDVYDVLVDQVGASPAASVLWLYFISKLVGGWVGGFQRGEGLLWGPALPTQKGAPSNRGDNFAKQAHPLLNK
jgi:hypothetical protein